MKKLIYMAVVALAVGAVSCGKTDSDNSAKYFSKEATDSLLTKIGEAAGYGSNMQISNAISVDSTITKEAFLKGLQYAMACDTSTAYINGVITGLQMQQQLKDLRRKGLDVNASMLVDGFKRTFLPDSMPSQMAMSNAMQDYRKWVDSLASAERNYQRSLLLASDEAKENAEKGMTYIKAQKAENDSVKISKSGLGYKIINEGQGPKADPNGVAVLRYTAKNVNGITVESVNGTPVRLSGRVDGLKEGVSMLGKGGKAVLYVPGSLGYGVEVPNNYNLGLNEMLIYEVEVLDVPEVPAAAK